MKLDPVFFVKESRLFRITDNTEINPDTLQKFEAKWTTVELEDEQYNEEFLAQLRDQLKALDNAGKFAVIIPVADKSLETPEQLELFINAFNHTARRIKDCVSVAGIELPEALLKKGTEAVQQFIDTLAIKHAQYVYFAKKASVTDTISSNKNLISSIVLY